MRILCAPDSYKDSLTAEQAALAMARGARRGASSSTAIPCALADGGEGTARTLVQASGGHLRTLTVRGPRGAAVEAAWGFLGEANGKPGVPTAVLDMASASGLTLLAAAARDPLLTSTYGTGELLRAALDQGAERIVLGLGGSATHDGGCGALQALGAQFYDVANQPISDVCGAEIERIARIDLQGIAPRWHEIDLAICCDVDNPLSGPNGAAFVYAPQKGAAPREIPRLDAGLAHLGTCWREQLNVDVTTLPGAGAAGGMGGGMVAMLGGRLQSGIELVLASLGFDALVADADLCLVGEGRFDAQSLRGKACMGVAKAAARAGVPSIGIFGAIASEASELEIQPLTAAYALSDGIELAQAIEHAEELLEARTAEIVAAFAASQSSP